MIDKTKTSLKK